MSGKRRRRGPGKKVNNPPYVTCSVHGKKGYLSKRDASRAARMFHHGEHMSVYPCGKDEFLWHIGHLPSAVIKRAVPREVVFR